MIELLPENDPVSALRFLLLEAVNREVSDIHIEPMDRDCRVRFRIGGDLSECFHFSQSLMKGLQVRIKVVAGMDIGESRRPQDGSFSRAFSGRLFDFRVSFLPTIYGESIVIRVLSGHIDFIEENRLGMTEEQEFLFRQVLANKSGLVLACGPTGSGKTSTLYAALRLVSTPKVKVISIEDPVEYHMAGVTQVEVNEKSGLTFAKGLRAVVRQDPDILMVGEIRDRETADIAIEAALTGHLVLSSLHTASVAAAAVRLQDMGIPAYLLASALSLVMAQRLVRDISSVEKREIFITKEIQRKLFLPEAFIGKKGYQCVRDAPMKRRGIFEMFAMNDVEKKGIYEGKSEGELTELMQRLGHKTLKELAVDAMEKGEMSMSEAAVVYENG